MTAPTVDAQRVSAATSAPAATSADIEAPREAVVGTTMPSSGTTPGTPINTSNGPADGSAGPASGSPTSKPSAKPSGGSTRRWRSPRTAMEFAAQANAVATLLLNGEIELELARTYSAVARTVAQAMSTEVSRARFIQSEPSLALEQGVFEEPTPTPTGGG